MLFPLLLLTSLTVSVPAPGAEAHPALTQAVQEPSKAKPAPKESPKPAPPPKPGGSARTHTSPGGGSARPQAPRGNPGGTPRATGEPRLKRRGS